MKNPVRIDSLISDYLTEIQKPVPYLKSKMQIYNEVMQFIDNTKDIELFKNIIIESFDNSSDITIIEEAYYNHIEKNEQL